MKLSVYAYTDYNGASYTIGGYIVTKDPSDIDACVSRLVTAGNIEEDEIRVIYTGENEFAIIIQSKVYNSCCSTIISDFARRLKECENDGEEDEEE